MKISRILYYFLFIGLAGLCIFLSILLVNKNLNFEKEKKLILSKYLHLSRYFFSKTDNYEKIKKLLTIYDIEGIKPNIRIGRKLDGGYVISKTILEDVDVLMAYGTADDVSFEEDFNILFKKPVYAFDCSQDGIPTTNPNIKFVKECLGKPGDSNLYGNIKSNGLVFDMYDSQIKKLKLEDKKIILKVDIEGGEYGSLDTISKKALKNIYGIIVEIHNLHQEEDQLKAIKLLGFLNQHFTLNHLHINNYGKMVTFSKNDNVINFSKLLPEVAELTFINNRYVKQKVKATKTYDASVDFVNDVRQSYDYQIDNNV